MGNKEVTDGPGITAGGGVNFGEISNSQVAIGENITIIANKDGSKSWLYTQGIRPTTDPANIFGRLQELDKIDEFFKSNSALVITGVRQTGKSTLASMYLDIIEKRGGFAGIYWRRMDETTDISDVVGSFFTVIGKPIQELGRYKVVDLLNLFFREMNAAQYFLVLDNFEILLDPHTNKPIKPGFSDVIEKVNEGGKSRFLFTSWECPESEGGTRPEYYCIGGLDEKAAIKLLRREVEKKNLPEFDDGDLKRVIELSGGHPKALILLAYLINEGEKLSSILDDSVLWKGEIAKNILDKVYSERLFEEERKLLQYVSLYRKPIPLKAMVFEANNPALTEAVVKKIALKLRRKSLLQKTEREENYWEDSLIHDYAYNKLDDKVKHHKLACSYYLTLPLPEERTKIEDIQPLIEAHYHACMAREYDKAVSIIINNNLEKYLSKWGNNRLLIEIYSGVLPKDPFNDKPLLSIKEIHIFTIGLLGMAYFRVGESKKAIKYLIHILAFAKIYGIKDLECQWLGNLGDVYYYLSEMEKAIECYTKALRISQEIGDRLHEGMQLGGLGNICRFQGNFQKAIDYYKEALNISREIGDRRNEGQWTANLGIVYRQLNEPEKSIDCNKKALEIAQEIGNKQQEGEFLGNIGSAYCSLNEVEIGIKYYKKALSIAHEKESLYDICVLTANIANVYHFQGKSEKAIECYKEALKISRKIGDRIAECQVLGNMGSAYCVIGNERKGIECFEKALEIAKEINNKHNQTLLQEKLYFANLITILKWT